MRMPASTAASTKIPAAHPLATAYPCTVASATTVVLCTWCDAR